jgi:hypothetical protein
VKCLCVHGTCPKGSQYCDRCDPGWEGKLCDVKIQKQTASTDEDEFIKAGSRLRRPKTSAQPKREERPESRQPEEDNSWFYRQTESIPTKDS